MRLGSRRTVLQTVDCIAAKLYQQDQYVDERHRHRCVWLSTEDPAHLGCTVPLQQQPYCAALYHCNTHSLCPHPALHLHPTPHPQVRSQPRAGARVRGGGPAVCGAR